MVLHINKTVSKIGNSPGVTFDSALRQLAHLKVSGEANVEVHAGGAITIPPMNPSAIEASTAAETARQLIQKNNRLFRRLS